MLFGHVVDQLHNQNGLTDAGATEQACLAALGVRLEEVDDLDTGLEHLDIGGLLVEPRRLAVNRQAMLGVDRSFIVDRLAEDVQDPAERLAPDRHHDRTTCVDRFHPPHHAVGRLHGDAANLVLTDVIGDLRDDVDRNLAQLAVVDDADGVVDRREVAFLEFDVERRSDNLNHLADALRLGFVVCHVFSVVYCAADAPETISMISLVMAAWRMRL